MSSRVCTIVSATLTSATLTIVYGSAGRGRLTWAISNKRRSAAYRLTVLGAVTKLRQLLRAFSRQHDGLTCSIHS